MTRVVQSNPVRSNSLALWTAKIVNFFILTYFQVLSRIFPFKFHANSTHDQAIIRGSCKASAHWRVLQSISWVHRSGHFIITSKEAENSIKHNCFKRSSNLHHENACEMLQFSCSCWTFKKVNICYIFINAISMDYCKL